MMPSPALPPHNNTRYSLVLYQCDSLLGTRTSAARAIFRSQDHWLHPLFALEHYLTTEARAAERSRYIIYDTIIGLAAAYMILHLAIPTVLTGVASETALQLLAQYDTTCIAAQTVAAIDCRTEQLLRRDRISCIDQAYHILWQLRTTGIVRHTQKEAETDE